MTKKNITVLVLAAFVAACASTKEIPVTPNPLYAYYEGVWLGDVVSSAFDGTTQMEGFPMTEQIRLDIRGEDSVIYSGVPNVENGKAISLNIYAFTGTKDIVTGSFLHSGGDGDGLWQEHQNMVLSRIDDKSTYIYFLRAVNNTQMESDSPQSKFAVFSRGKLVKVDR